MIFISCSSKGKIYSYNEIEKILIQKTKTAYGKDGNLPSLNQKIEIGIEELVEAGSLAFTAPTNGTLTEGL